MKRSFVYRVKCFCVFLVLVLLAGDGLAQEPVNANQSVAQAEVSSQSAQLTPAVQSTQATQAVQTEQAAQTAQAEQATQTAQTSDDSVADEDGVLDDEDFPVFKDPNENFNRVMFSFNDKLDKVILKPLATVYESILPKPISQGVTNFFNNIRTLPTIANDILQLHLYQAYSDTWRLMINTTVGIGGIFDVASRIGLVPYQNDFGLTMARWGYQESNYLVWPFFGPSSLRDGIGLPVDYYLFSVYPHIEPYRTRYAIYAVGVIDRRGQLLNFQNVLEEAAVDDYVFIRNAYLQRRAFEIEQNQQQGILTQSKTDDSDA